MTKPKEKKPDKKLYKNILEWVVFSISMLAVAGTLAYLTYQTYTYESAPPDFHLSYIAEKDIETYRYHLTVENRGETAGEVKIELLLQKNNTTIERSEVHLPFVPKKSKRESWFQFSKNPALADTIVARVMSFCQP